MSRAARIAVIVLAFVAPAAAQMPGLDADWKGAKPGFEYFRYEVLPLLRPACGTLECHGGFAGGRLRLPAPLETGEYSNAAARSAYDGALALVNADDRPRSLILLKPAAPVPGMPVVKHEGPKRLGLRAEAESDRRLYGALLDWVKGRRVANFTPYAFPGRNRIVSVGRKVVLDGSMSFDPNPKDRLRHKWTVVFTPAGSAAADPLKGAGKPFAEFVADKAGAYVFRLAVKDRTRTSDAGYVTVFADPNAPVFGPDEPDVRVDERRRLTAADAVVTAPAEIEADPAAPGGKKLVVPAAAEAEGRAVFTVTIETAGRYGLWLQTIDPGEASQEAVGVEIDGKLVARIPVLPDETWRTVRFGGVRMQSEDDGRPARPEPPPKTAGLEAHKVASGRWQIDPNSNRLVAYGVGLGPAGRNLAHFGIAGDELTHVRAVINATSKHDIRNGYIVFDYRSPTDFKIAGLTVNADEPSKGRLEIDWVGGPAGAAARLKTVDTHLVADRDYVFTLKLEGGEATLLYEGRPVLSQTFAAKFLGAVGLASFQAETEFDGVHIWKNRQYVFGDLANRPSLRDDAADDADDPVQRLRAHVPPTFALTPGRHTIALLLPPGAAPIAAITLARPEPPAKIDPAARRTARAVYLDLLGRTPTEAELDRDGVKTPGRLAAEIVRRYEFAERLYEDELLRLGLTENYRPVSEEDPEAVHYPALPAQWAAGAVHWRDLMRRLVYGVYFHARNFGDEDYPRALWFAAFDADILDEPEAGGNFTPFEFARCMYTEGAILDNDEIVNPKAPKKKPAPRKWTLFGKVGKNRADLVDICLSQPRFAEAVAGRLYRSITGLEPAPAEVRADAAKLTAAWNNGREALSELIAGWFDAPRYADRLKAGRVMDDARFLRSVFTDLFGRPPDHHEFRRLHRPFTRIEPQAVRAGLRAAVVAMMVRSGEMELPPGPSADEDWIGRQIVRLHARAPKAGEVRSLAELLAEPAGTPRLLVEGLITHRGYSVY